MGKNSIPGRLEADWEALWGAWGRWLVQGKHHNYKEFIFIQLVEVLPTAAWREVCLDCGLEKIWVVSNGLLYIYSFNVGLVVEYLRQRLRKAWIYFLVSLQNSMVDYVL